MVIAQDLVSDSIPSVKPSDDARRVLGWMTEFKVRQLPLVDQGALIGLVSEEDLIDADSPTDPVGGLDRTLSDKTFVFEDNHFYEVLRQASLHRLDVLPVLSARDNNYVGVITLRDILEVTGAVLNVVEPGGLIVLEVAFNSYSLSEIARICESNDAKILSLSVANSPNPQHLYVSLKLNIRELSRVIATFERFNYTIVKVVFDAEQLDDYRERYENLLRYLNL